MLHLSLAVVHALCHFALPHGELADLVGDAFVVAYLAVAVAHWLRSRR